MVQALFAIIVLLALLWLVARVLLRGPDLGGFDAPTGERFGSGRPPSPELQTVLTSLAGVRGLLRGLPRSAHLAALRRHVDDLFADRTLDAVFVDTRCEGVAAEWVLAPGADPARRTLYIHGGAFMMGSPRSHRTLTSQFSALTGGAVLAVDYRLMPEYPRQAGIDDCRSSYHWMLANGPDGAAPAQAVFVAGDSAGGNLALSLIAWVRDQGLRAPDAAVALSPATDSTLGSPSLRAHIATDAMLGPLFGKLARLPRTVLLWAGWMQARIRPGDPVVSPVFGNLAGLPPVLVQASEIEMLRDDARRYVNRARAAGSPVQLQTWDHMVHVWQIFNPELPEAREALAEIGRFLARAAPSGR